MPNCKETLFYPMVTGRAQGTGLGLPIAQGIMQQHSGLIECLSQPKQTVFRILIPFEQNKPAKSQHERREHLDSRRRKIPALGAGKSLQQSRLYHPRFSSGEAMLAALKRTSRKYF